MSGGGDGPRDQRPLLEGGRAVQLGAIVPAGGLLATGRVTAALKVAASGGTARQWVGILCLEEADGARGNLGEGVLTLTAS